MIHIENLTKRFGRFAAVSELCLDVEAGEAVVLWGANGAGKTTVIRCVLGLYSFAGRIEVGKLDVARAGKATRHLVGYFPQELAFYDDQKLLDAVGFFCRLRSVGPQRGREVLEEVGLTEHQGKRIRELSGGMKQRLALALALLSDPPVLLLDELTSNLDAEAQSAFISLLSNLKQGGKTILFTSHRFDEVESLADRVIVLDKGRKKLECAPEELSEAEGARCLLKVYVAEEKLDEAVTILSGVGFSASRNGRGLFVEVPVREKAGPIHALSAENIRVQSFDLASPERRDR
jgi:ABC-type multidrug transport system ATPase subunit